MQKVQGTGSIFGDSSAKSDSIRRSIEQLTTNSNDMLPINQGMLTALQNIESSMTGLTNLVVRTTGLTDGANMGIQTGTLSRSMQIDPLLGAVGGGAAAGAYLGSMAGAFMGPLGIVLGTALGSVLVVWRRGYLAVGQDHAEHRRLRPAIWWHRARVASWAGLRPVRQHRHHEIQAVRLVEEYEQPRGDARPER
jgi:hypothetical protein